MIALCVGLQDLLISLNLSECLTTDLHLIYECLILVYKLN